MVKTMVLFKIICTSTLLTFVTCDHTRVIGGEATNIEEVPFMALFRPVGVSYYCGASIVSDKFLITAAHCVSNKLTFEVTVGTDKALSGGRRHAVEKVVKHPRYDLDSQFNNDIAVVILKSRLQFNHHVQPIKLAERDIFIQDTAQFRIIGFGKTESSEASNQLLSATIPYVPPSQCSQFYIHLTPQMICAGQNDKGGCFGDSGGPLVYGDKLVGAVSFGSLNCNIPAVFARISALRDFIDDVINNN